MCSSTASIGDATGDDNCSFTISDDAPSVFIGVTTVTYVITDASGNSASCTQEVTINDNEDPTITCPSDITINTDTGSCSSTESIGDASGSDNCTFTISDDAPTEFVGITSVTYVITDASGNTTSCTQEVTVNDLSLIHI